MPLVRLPSKASSGISWYPAGKIKGEYLSIQHIPAYPPAGGHPVGHYHREAHRATWGSDVGQLCWEVTMLTTHLLCRPAHVLCKWWWWPVVTLSISRLGPVRPAATPADTEQVRVIRQRMDIPPVWQIQNHHCRERLLALWLSPTASPLTCLV